MATVRESAARRPEPPAADDGGRRARLRRAPDGGVLPVRPHRRPRRGGQRARALPAARPGIRWLAMLPLYRTVRDVAPDLEPVGTAVPGADGRAHRGGPALPRRRAAARARRSTSSSISTTSTAPASTARTPSTIPTTRAASRSSRWPRSTALPRLVSGPVLLHAHDWHTALAPVYLRTTLADRALRGARRARCSSVHNPGLPGPLPARRRCPTSACRGRSTTGTSSSGTGR